MIISGVSPEPSGIGSSGTSSTPILGVAATDSRRTQLTAKARINRLTLKNGLRLFGMGTTPQSVGIGLGYRSDGAVANDFIATIIAESRIVQHLGFPVVGL